MGGAGKAHVDQQRRLEAEQERLEAVTAAARAHPRVKHIADENLELAAKRQELQPESELAQQQLAGLRPDPEDLKKQLDKDALLMDIEIRDETDRARKDKRLERFEAIRTKMGDDDRKALIMMIEDDTQRAALIRDLIEQDMTPEQRATLK